MRIGEERGQVIVEQAIILPMMVFLVLGIVQLTMLQQARVATEYAAFNAARSGIVYSGNEDMMQRAAYLSLIPTMGRADTIERVFVLAAKATIQEVVADFLDTLSLPGLPSAHQVEVEILEPQPTVFDSNIARHLNGEQIDFDDIRDEAAEANRLSIRLLYYYEMRVPFANWMIQTMWLAHRLGTLQNMGGINFANPEIRVGGMTTGASAVLPTTAAAAGGGDLEEMRNVAQLRLMGVGYYFPLNAHHTMRMQSNLYKSNL